MKSKFNEFSEDEMIFREDSSSIKFRGTKIVYPTNPGSDQWIEYVRGVVEKVWIGSYDGEDLIIRLQIYDGPNIDMPVTLPLNCTIF